MRDIPDNIIGQMAKQCYLTRPQFLDLVDCPMDRTAFEDVLSSRDVL